MKFVYSLFKEIYEIEKTHHAASSGPQTTVHKITFLLTKITNTVKKMCVLDQMSNIAKLFLEEEKDKHLPLSF